MKAGIAAGVLALAFGATGAQAATGNDMISWGYSPEGTTYLNGVFGGYVTGTDNALNGILYCVPADVTNGQAAAIVWKWLKANPERWSETGTQLIISAMQNAFSQSCLKKGK